MSCLRAFYSVLVFAFVTPTFAVLPAKTLDSIRDQLKAKNPNLAAGSVIKVSEAKTVGETLEKVGTPVLADYQSENGDTFRYDIYLYRKGKLLTLGKGLLGAEWISGVWAKDGLYYSLGEGSGIYRCTVGRLADVKGELQRSEFVTDYGLSLRQDKTKIIAGLDVSSSDNGFRAIGEVKVLKGNLCLVDAKGKAVDVSAMIKWKQEAH